jgi:hypothetical protein
VANALYRFKDRDVQRVIRAVRLAGLSLVAVEVDPYTGRIKVHTLPASSPAAAQSGSEPTSCDRIVHEIAGKLIEAHGGEA